MRNLHLWGDKKKYRETIFSESAAGCCISMIPGRLHPYQCMEIGDNSIDKKTGFIRRGDLYLANHRCSGCGSKQGGVRPVVVLQNDVGNYYAPTITVLRWHRNWEKAKAAHAFLSQRKAKGLAKPSMVLAEQLDTCDKICVIRYLGRVK